MSNMTQGEAVYQAVKNIMGEQESYKPSREQLEAIHEVVLGLFLDGFTRHSKDPDEPTLRKYIPGLVNNWLRKDTRLNGGTKYVAKRPGSRSGSSDESIKAMRTLLSLTTDPEAKQAIQQEIDKRMAELKPAVTVNVNALPESLRHLVKQ